MQIAPFIIVPSLGAVFAYSCTAYALRDTARTEAQRALARKQVWWTTALTFLALIVVGLFVLP